MEVWEKFFPDHFKAKKNEEANMTKENGEKYVDIMEKRVNKVRREFKRPDNFIPYLKPQEENNFLKDNVVKQFTDKLQLSLLRTPFVMNTNKFKNEDKFSTLFNSDNCYEDSRVKELMDSIKKSI